MSASTTTRDVMREIAALEDPGCAGARRQGAPKLQPPSVREYTLSVVIGDDVARAILSSRARN